MKRVIALGFFDGIHIGHQALCNMTRERAKELGAEPAVISFDIHPDCMIKNEKVELINTPDDRVALIKRLCGIDETIFLHFDKELMHMPWEEFLDMLVEWFDAEHLVAGYDFTFGYKGEGNSEKLKAKCASIGIGCDVVDKVELRGETVSSTAIRKLLRDGNIKKANEFLGHEHTFTDTVRYGYKLGRKLGVPTINMYFSDSMVEMAHGVYASRATLEDGRVFNAVTNIGVRPTVGGTDKVSVESHLLDYSGYLYGKKVRLDFCDFLRPERKFEDVAALQKQIFSDRDTVREYFKKARDF